MNKLIIGLVALFVAFGGGYLYRGKDQPKTVEKEKIVVKYLKADKIEIKPDGTVIAGGGASLDSKEQEKERTEIKGYNSFAMPYIKLGKRIDTAGLFVGKDIFDGVALTVGTRVDWSNPKVDYEILAGVKIDFNL